METSEELLEVEADSADSVWTALEPLPPPIDGGVVSDIGGGDTSGCACTADAAAGTTDAISVADEFAGAAALATGIAEAVGGGDTAAGAVGGETAAGAGGGVAAALGVATTAGVGAGGVTGAGAAATIGRLFTAA